MIPRRSKTAALTTASRNDKDGDYSDKVYNNAPEDIRKIIRDVIWGLMMKMNVPEEEAIDLVKTMEKNDMGVLFANMEEMDIQKERANTRREKERADSAEQRVNNAEERANNAEQRVNSAEERANNAEQRANSVEQRVKELEAFIHNMRQE